MGFLQTLGGELRRARREAGLTLREMGRRGEFKASALGGYERGERSISLERFCRLASAYSVPPDRLLGQVFDSLSPGERSTFVIDLRASPAPDEAGHRLLSDFVEEIRRTRGDGGSAPINVRSGDVEMLARRAGVDTRTLLDRLEPALRPSESGGR